MHSQLPTPKVSRSLQGASKVPPLTFAAGLAQTASANCPSPAGHGSALAEKPLPFLPRNPQFPPSVLSETSSPNSFLSSSPGSLPGIIHWSPTSFWNHLPEPPLCPSPQAVVRCSLQLCWFSSGAPSPPSLLKHGSSSLQTLHFPPRPQTSLWSDSGGLHAAPLWPCITCCHFFHATCVLLPGYLSWFTSSARVRTPRGPGCDSSTLERDGPTSMQTVKYMWNE